MTEHQKPEVFSYFDETTNAACYILKDPLSASCAVIDSILDFDFASGRISTNHADMLIDEIQSKGFILEWIIETHVHADHLSAAPYLAKKFSSKIAIGSGGLFGKGFLNGSQSHLNFLPEKQTDFIFTMLAEEFGLFGGLFVILLFFIIIGYGYVISFHINNKFGRLVTLGMTTAIFLYVFINIGMVMGLIPIVGVPLPFISYGGTSLLATMMAVGFILNGYIFRDIDISRFSSEQD